jgi:hypothetical protein
MSRGRKSINALSVVPLIPEQGRPEPPRALRQLTTSKRLVEEFHLDAPSSLEGACGAILWPTFRSLR